MIPGERIHLRKSRWLTLSEASEVLGIHSATLREWVDAKVIPSFRTPGGHRRFDFPDLQNFLQSRKSGLPILNNGMDERNTLETVRSQLGTNRILRQSWYRRLNKEERSREREMGQRMLGLLIQYSSRSENAEHFLSQGRALSRSFGKDFARLGLSPSAMVRAFLFFQQAILNATHHPQDTNAPHDWESMRLYQRIHQFMDEMLLSTLDAYEEARAGKGCKRIIPLSPSKTKLLKPASQ